MNEQTLTNSENQTYYSILVNGQSVGPKYTSPQTAELAMLQLSETQQTIAEVVPVNEAGQQILFG